MEKLQLKKEYRGLVMTKKCHNLGDVTFDTNNVPQNMYNNYFRLEAFTHMFEYVDACDKCAQQDCICKSAAACAVCGEIKDECSCSPSEVASAEVKKYTGVTQNKKK